MLMKLAGKIAIVTGAGRGIGRVTALALAQEGAHLVLAARTVSELEVVAEEIRSVGREALAVATDVAKKVDVDAMVQQTLKRFGRVDILINNAGFADHKAIPDISEEDWDIQINVNLKAVFLCTQAVFTPMCAQGSGHIVNVSSLAGKYYPYKMAAYSSAKWGLGGLTGVTQEEGRPHGVRAILIRPGNVDTQMQHDNHDVYPEKLMQPEDIAAVILLALTQNTRAYTPVLDVYPSENVQKEDSWEAKWYGSSDEKKRELYRK
ncbi:MAG: hypothetical protein CL911_03350 [Deltaproteobacteria bacterium]|nr:hypothetical protein [Deltaproteobacteria bacterium]